MAVTLQGDRETCSGLVLEVSEEVDDEALVPVVTDPQPLVRLQPQPGLVLSPVSGINYLQFIINKKSCNRL